MTRLILILCLTIWTSFTLAQDDKIIGKWTLVRIEYEDSTMSQLNYYGERWIEFLSDHSLKYGVFPTHTMKRGTWNYEHSNNTLNIVFSDDQENVLTWSIMKLTVNYLAIGKEYPYVIFERTN